MIYGVSKNQTAEKNSFHPGVELWDTLSKHIMHILI